MKKRLQIISSLLCLAAMLGTASLAWAQTPAEAQLRDLSAFGIMTGDENGNLRLEDTITRAEAVKMVCTAGGIKADANAQEQPFDDVTQAHWAYGYICAAKQADIVNGDEAGHFNPESRVTNEEIVKMLVCLLGYTPLTEARGGYPAGYTAAAAQIGITEDMQLPVNTPAVRGDVAVMFGRALDVPLMRRDEDEEDAVFFVADGKNGHPSETLRSALLKGEK